jgi:UDP-N-acetylglucosamine-lysosomal-enzyme
MPHFIQKDVLERLMEDFPEQWKSTSSHPFRASNDMQFAFSYFYYLINEREADVWPRLVRYFVDTDKDDFVSFNEFRTVWVLTHNTPINELDMSDTFDLLSLNRSEPVSIGNYLTIIYVFFFFSSFFRTAPGFGNGLQAGEVSAVAGT